MQRLVATFLVAALLPACHSASTPSPQPATHDAAESEPAPEQTAQMQSMMEQLQKQLAEAMADIQVHPPGGATIIPPLTVDPPFTISDEQFIKQLEEQLRIQLHNPPPAPEAQP